MSSQQWLRHQRQELANNVFNSREYFQNLFDQEPPLRRSVTGHAKSCPLCLVERNVMGVMLFCVYGLLGYDVEQGAEYFRHDQEELAMDVFMLRLNKTNGRIASKYGMDVRTAADYVRAQLKNTPAP